MRIVDMDANATRPATDAALEAFTRAEALARPVDIADSLDQSRRQIATGFGAHPDEIVFTRGGSHANAMALWAGVWACDALMPTLALSRAEHRASIDTAQEIQRAQRAHIAWLDVGADGCINPEEIKGAQQRRGLSLVSLLAAHNETGVVQSLDAIAAQCALLKTPWHLDAVQLLGRLPLPWTATSCTMLSVAGHKVGSLGGIGALLVRRGSDIHRRLVAQADGPFARGFAYSDGPLGASAGLCASFAAAVATIEAHQTKEAMLAPLRDQFERQLTERLRVHGVAVSIVGRDRTRLPNTSLLRLPGLPAEGVLMALDIQGFSASSGSACKAGAPEPSASLMAMGFSETAAREVIRVSLRWPHPEEGQTLSEDVHRLVDAIDAIVQQSLSLS